MYVLTFNAVKIKIPVKGTIVTYRPVGLTPSICWKSPMAKKKILAYRLNCSKRNLGKNVHKVYLATKAKLDFRISIKTPG